MKKRSKIVKNSNHQNSEDEEKEKNKLKSARLNKKNDVPEDRINESDSEDDHEIDKQSGSAEFKKKGEKNVDESDDQESEDEKTIKHKVGSRRLIKKSVLEDPVKEECDKESNSGKIAKQSGSAELKKKGSTTAGISKTSPGRWKKKQKALDDGSNGKNSDVQNSDAQTSDNDSVEDKEKAGSSSRLLKKGNKRSGLSDDADETYDVSKILDFKLKGSQKYFLVRWKNYGRKDDTWEPEYNLECPDLLEKFMAKLDKAKGVPAKELRQKRTLTDRYCIPAHGRRLSKRACSKNMNYREE